MVQKENGRSGIKSKYCYGNVENQVLTFHSAGDRQQKFYEGHRALKTAKREEIMKLLRI